MIDTTDLLDLSFDELTQRVVDWGQPRFRATQIWRWVYHSLVSSPAAMLNLPQELRQRLATETYISTLQPIRTLASDDGLTEKVLFQTHDGHTFETVLMRYNNRNTVCVSSQIGCAIGCDFCATGRSGFVRDLTVGEITGQVLYEARRLRQDNAALTNVVLMGMGEPMLNLDNVWRAMLNLNHREGLALGARRFTLSTAGVVPGIERLARESFEVGLAISLHAPDNALRNQLVPLNRRYPLEQVLQACKLYIEHTGRRVTFEYALIKDLNDSEQHARRTAELLRGLLAHVNLIPLNPTPDCAYQPSPPERVLRFQQVLTHAHLPATVRLWRGIDIQAGCGQLRSQYLTTEDDKS